MAKKSRKIKARVGVECGKQPRSDQPVLPFLQIAILTSVFVLVALGAYWRVLGFGFSPLDDHLYVINNPVIRSLGLESLSAMFLLKFAGNYSPLHILTYALEYKGWGVWPAGYHAMNIILHGLNAGLVAALCFRFGMGRLEGALTALLFLIHPVQVESVAWISELKSLLAGGFFAGSFILYIRDRERGARWPSIAPILLFLAANLSKPSAIAFPLLILVYHFVFHGDGLRDSARRASPFFAVSVFTGIMAMSTQTGGVWGGLEWHFRLPFVWSMTGLMATEYVQHLLFPIRLSPYYYIVPEEVLPVLKIAGLLLLLFALAMTVRWTAARRKEGFFAAWFFVLLLPNANIFPLDVLIADRYVYLPSIGLIALFSITVLRLRGALPRVVQKRLVSALTAVIVLSLWIITFGLCSVWKNDITLYGAIVRDNPAPRILMPLVRAYQEVGNDALMQETARTGIDAVGRELTRQPDNWELYQQLGYIYQVTGERGKAKAALLKAMDLAPNEPRVLSQLAQIDIQDKDFKSARELLEGAALRYPYLLDLRLNLVVAMAGLGDYAAARAAAEEILQRWPDNKIAVAQLADICKITGDTERAISLYRKVIDMDPGSKLAHDAEAMIQSLGAPRK